MYDIYLTTETYSWSDHPLETDGLIEIAGEIRLWEDGDRDLDDGIVVGRLLAYRVFTDEPSAQEFLEAMAERSALAHRSGGGDCHPRRSGRAGSWRPARCH